MLIRTDTLQPWRGELINGVRHPPNIEDLWSVPALAAAGLVKAIPMVVPTGFRPSGPATYALDGTETIPLEPIPQPTQQEIDAARDGMAAVLDDRETGLRALLGVVLEELNRHSAVHRAILAAAASATSLADFKTRMGTIDGVPARQFGDLRQAFRNRLGT